jgi:hypothetical protein
MSHLYNFGLSQEDERSEARALGLRPADRVLSIVSAGEMPLSLLSMGVAQVLAVDIDPAQLHLARLKLAAVCTLERSDAIRFLGRRTASPDQRHDWFDAVLDHLPPGSQTFWRAHRVEAGPGAIWAGRFEQYLSRITRYAIPLLGRRRVTGIFECRTLAEQEAYFDSRLDLRAVRLLLRVAFNRKVYASRGVDPRSLQYRTGRDEPLGVQFYRQFRNALTRTPAQENYLMQLILALQNSIRRPGLGWERTYLARRDEEIVGVLGAWDTGAFHATRVVSYSAAATIARGVHAAARTVLREAAPLPEPGEAFPSLTITNRAVRGGDPRVLRALLSAVNNDHISQGFHLMHLGATAGEDWASALRGWLRQRFSSSLYALTRTGGLEPPEGSLSNLYLDLSII